MSKVQELKSGNGVVTLVYIPRDIVETTRIKKGDKVEFRVVNNTIVITLVEKAAPWNA